MRLLQKLQSGELALGVFMKGGPHIVATLAKAGFDFVRPDMMFSAIDWKELEHIIRASEAAGITTMVRLAANPWLAGESNMQITVDAARAFSLGAKAVQVSVSSAKQAEALLAVTQDWHRSGTGQYPSTQAEMDAHRKRIAEEALFVPSIESASAIRDVDAILELGGLRAIFIASTDFAEQLGHRFDYEHPKVWAAVDRIVGKARSRGVTVFANTGYVYKSRETIVKRVKQMHDHGIQVVMIQGIEFLMENYSRELIGDIGSAITR
jgi:2-keto-3-deoxy-L-rhamnonate aldolase RhmA